MPICKTDQKKDGKQHRVRINYVDQFGKSRQLCEEINIQEISRRLGHENVTITWNTYSHLYPKEEERAIEILNKIV